MVRFTIRGLVSLNQFCACCRSRQRQQAVSSLIFCLIASFLLPTADCRQQQTRHTKSRAPHQSAQETPQLAGRVATRAGDTCSTVLLLNFRTVLRMRPWPGPSPQSLQQCSCCHNSRHFESILWRAHLGCLTTGTISSWSCLVASTSVQFN